MKKSAWSIAVLVVFFPACRKTPAPAAAPPEVEVAPVVKRDVPNQNEWIGTLDGSVNADIRPRVEGYLLRLLYKEGQFVKAGAPLFQIDTRAFRASLEQAQGAVGQAEAVLAKTDKDVERFTPLAAEHAVSQQEVDDAVSAQRNATAALSSARAARDQASLNLNWTTVTSPIDGIVGIANTQVGALVGPTTVMTTVSTVDPIRVTFGISEQEYMRRALRINRATYATTMEGPVLHLILDDGTTYSLPGRGINADREVDPRTGTMTIKGLFPNPQHVLRPGQYARVRADMEVVPGALLVPQKAVIELQGGQRVAVVGGDSKVDMRNVELGPRIDEEWVVLKGVKEGEKVIVTGLQFVKPGVTVKVKQ